MRVIPSFLLAAGAAATAAGFLLAEGDLIGGSGLIAVAFALVGMRYYMATRRPW